MKSLILGTLFSIILISVNFPAKGGEFTWECKINEAFDYYMEIDGERVIWRDKELQKNIYIGVAFEVSKESGRISGGPLKNYRTDNALIEMIEDHTIITRYPLNVDVFHISPWVEGIQKPFTAYSTFNGFLAGYCE